MERLQGKTVLPSNPSFPTGPPSLINSLATIFVGGVVLSAPFRFPRFFVTTPAPCPYLVGKTERKVFTELSGPHSSELNDALGRIGFRRSQNVAYRPSCLDCTACISVRVVAGEFQPST